MIGFLDALDLSTVHLVGHSMGCAVVTAVAGDPAAAGRVASLTLISPAGYGPEINADYLWGFAAAETRALATLSARLVDGIDVTAAQASFGGPTVVVWGAQDAVVPASNAASLDGRATVHLVDGAGHMAQMERPHEVVAAIQQAVGSN